MVTELNKFALLGLLHFHKGILPSYVAEVFLSKALVCLKVNIFGIRELDWYIDTKSDGNESVLIIFHNKSVLFYT